MITVKDFVEDFKSKKIQNTKINEHAVSDYIKSTLAVKTYIPFRQKREIVEMVVAQNLKEVYGVKKHDPINQYVSFVVAMIGAHTDMEFSDDPVVDYDLLAESGLLPRVISEFKASYDECDILLKMALASELEDNNINVTVARFLDGILKKLDSVGEVLKSQLGDFDIKKFLGADFNEEDLANLKGFLNKNSK